jgi:hypothetical protein
MKRWTGYRCWTSRRTSTWSLSCRPRNTMWSTSLSFVCMTYANMGVYGTFLFSILQFWDQKKKNWALALSLYVFNAKNLYTVLIETKELVFESKYFWGVQQLSYFDYWKYFPLYFHSPQQKEISSNMQFFYKLETKYLKLENYFLLTFLM